MNKLLCIGLGGIVGTFARYFLSSFVQHRIGKDFPFGTMAVNLIGCFLVGIFASLAEHQSAPAETRLFLITGFCGAFTTFSALILETSGLSGRGEPGPAFLNVLISVVAGLILFRLGLLTVRRA